ncbi:hypothetical protein LguiB_006990 [Lonicera macranthoides]
MTNSTHVTMKHISSNDDASGLTFQKRKVKTKQGNDDTTGKGTPSLFAVLADADVSVYPKGRNNGDADSLSMYLEIVDTHTLTHDWEVYASYKLFVYDHLEDMYYTIQDVDSKIRRFRNTKTEWGFDRILTHQTFNDTSKGYIRDDACIFGAEVFVIKQNVLMKDVNPYTWKVEKFSTIKDDVYLSKTFVVGGHTWYSMH